MTFTQTYKQTSIFRFYSAPYLGLTEGMKEKMKMCTMSSLSLVITPRSRNQELLASFPSCDNGFHGGQGILIQGHPVSPGVEKEQNHYRPLYLELLLQNALCSTVRRMSNFGMWIDQNYQEAVRF